MSKFFLVSFLEKLFRIFLKQNEKMFFSGLFVMSETEWKTIFGIVFNIQFKENN